MTIEAVVQFLEATSEQEALRRDLAGMIGIGDGDISNAKELDQDEAQALLGARGVLVATFADQQGYAFTVAELNAVIGVFQRFQGGELSEAEFTNALGLKDSAHKLTSASKTVGLVYRGVRFNTDENPASSHQVFEFMKRTETDQQLREQLQEILKAGDGDISNFAELDPEEAQALKSERGIIVAEFAAQNGFMFTMADLIAVTDAFQRVQAGELTEAEFSKYLRLNVSKNDFFPVIKNVVELTYKGLHHSKAIPSAAQDNTLQVVRFMEKSEQDTALREQLQSIIGGDGNISDPGELDSSEAQVLISGHSKQIVELGAEHGLRFTVADLSAVVGAFQMVNTGKLSIDSCTRILGLKSDHAIDRAKRTVGLIYRGAHY
jgi:NOL1/NOP2/fmu family ribosome biogenesis protein